MTKFSVLPALAALSLCAGPARGQAATLADEGYQGPLPAAFRQPALAPGSTSELRRYIIGGDTFQAVVYVSSPRPSGGAPPLDALIRGMVQRARQPPEVAATEEAGMLVRSARYVAAAQGETRRAVARGYALREGMTRLVAVLMIGPARIDPGDRPELVAFLDSLRSLTAPPNAPASFRAHGVTVVTPGGFSPPVETTRQGADQPGMTIHSYGTGNGTAVLSIGVTELALAGEASPSLAVRQAVLRAYSPLHGAEVRDLEERPERNESGMLVRELQFTLPTGARVSQRVSTPLQGPVRIISLSWAQLGGRPADPAQLTAFFDSLRVDTPATGSGARND